MNRYMLRRYFIAGLLVWVPIWVTLLVIKFLVDLFDRSLSLIPREYQPSQLFGIHIPGLGILFTLIVVFLTGMLVTNFLGRRLVVLWEAFLTRIPLVRTIYSAVKQIMQTIFSSKGESFRKVFLVQYPRLGMWTIAFQTGVGMREAQEHIGEDLVSVFVPTTPNPTSGFLLLVPRKDVVELKMSVDMALKMIVSLGVVSTDSDAQAKVLFERGHT